MPSPFPGMDPYLEDPAIWPDFHNRLITYLVELLNATLPPDYFATSIPRVEIGVVGEAYRRAILPDVAVAQAGTAPEAAPASATSPATLELTTYIGLPPLSFIEIKRLPDHSLITVIELLSPVNKHPGNRAYDEYMAKRQEIVHAKVHLVELDLLRIGRRVLPMDDLPPAPYYAIITRATPHRYARTQIWAIQLDESLPILPVPLQEAAANTALPLGEALQRAYDTGRLAHQLDYSQPPLGPLTDAQRAYLNDLLAPYRDG